MNRTPIPVYRSLMAVVAMLASISCDANADEKAKDKPVEPLPGARPTPLEDPKPLFDGKSLDGWKEVGGGKWSLVDGEIVGEKGDGRYGWLVTDRTYSNFILELECKHEAAGNSGIQFRSRVIDGDMHGYQAEFDPRPTHGTGGVYEEKGRKWLAKPDAKGLAAMKPYQWNKYHIEAIGDRVILAVNDVVTVAFRDDVALSGIIALQVHSGARPVKVRWRSIRIQDLGDRGDFQPLFDGKTLKGWHTHGEANVWRAEEGRLIGELVKQSPYAYLATDRVFGDFELRLKMNYASTEGNSGVFFRSVFPPHCAKCNHVARELPEETADFKCPECGHAESLPHRERVHIHGPQAEFAPQNTGGLYDAGGGGWINKDKLTEKVQKLHRMGEWNDFWIRAEGKHVTVRLNGVVVSDVTDHPFAPRGHIALQLHSGGPMKVMFKDIRLRQLGEGEVSGER